jgi:signal transduction histidine kinase
MKLFTKYSRVNLWAMIIIFLFSSGAFYIAIRFILLKQVDDDLRIEQREIETYVKEHNMLPESIPVKDQKISYALSGSFLKKGRFRTVAGFIEADNGKDSYRILQFGVEASGKTYIATVGKSLEGTDVLTRSILLISLVTILLILVASLVINRILLKRLWKPFYDTLSLVKNFRVDKPQVINLPAAPIDEFAFMNQTLQRTTNQARKDYMILKEFTENASHEMQTPLAIIRSKLDLFIQHENLSEDQSRTMQGAYQAVEKLSRLNQSLLLLAKIENNQYAETSPVNFKLKLEEKTDAFHELWQSQNISVSTILTEVIVNMNNELADILLNNLLSNATRHNFSGGSIRIELTGNELKITNSSMQNQLNGQRLFSRFYKQDDKGKNGLGLSIIKQICEISGLDIHYLFDNNHHSFTLSWT